MKVSPYTRSKVDMAWRQIALSATAALTISTAASAQDRRARPLPANVAPTYPAMLRDAAFGGLVRIQFIVDTAGVPVIASLRVLHTDHEIFSYVVLRAVSTWRYAPALNRRRVRADTVVQSIEFIPPTGLALHLLPDIVSGFTQVAPAEWHLTISGPDSVRTTAVDSSTQLAVALAALDTILTNYLPPTAQHPARIACVALSPETAAGEPSMAMQVQLEKLRLAVVTQRRCPRTFGSPTRISYGDGRPEHDPPGEDPFLFTARAVRAMSDGRVLIDVDWRHATAMGIYHCVAVADPTHPAGWRARCRRGATGLS
jgi:hypothetical protein